jgi:plasmid stabilization system protein ParE
MLVIWRTEAMEDLEAARNYIAQDNPAAAERLFDRIMTTVDRLQDLPSMVVRAALRERESWSYLGLPTSSLISEQAITWR